MDPASAHELNNKVTKMRKHQTLHPCVTLFAWQEELKAKVQKARHACIGTSAPHVMAFGTASTYPVLKREVSRRTTALGGDRRGEKGKSSEAVHGLCFGRIVDYN